MADIEGAIVIERPVEEVFDFVADQRNEPRYNPRMVKAEKVTIGRIGVGTRYHSTITSRRRPVGVVVEVTRYDRPVRLASHTYMDTADVEGTLTFEPVPEGTRMAWSWRVEPHGARRLVRSVVRWRGRRQEAQVWAGLKQLLENGHSS